MPHAPRSAARPRPAREPRVQSRHPLAPLAILAVALIAYHKTFNNPFIFDDVSHIERNPTIRHLWPPWEAMAYTSRPLVQLSFAVNYAVSRLEVWSYHALNLLIHLLAGLVLFGLIRRTLERPEIP